METQSTGLKRKGSQSTLSTWLTPHTAKSSKHRPIVSSQLDLDATESQSKATNTLTDSVSTFEAEGDVDIADILQLRISGKLDLEKKK